MIKDTDAIFEDDVQTVKNREKFASRGVVYEIARQSPKEIIPQEYR